MKESHKPKHKRMSSPKTAANPSSVSASTKVSPEHPPPSTSGSGTLDSQFIDNITNIIFTQTSNSYFPLDISLSSVSDEVAQVLKKFNLPCQKQLSITNKSLSDKLVPRLVKLDPSLKLDYSKFISHPGNLFVKNLSKTKLNHSKMFKFFNSHSSYRSLGELNIFNQTSTNDDDVFAILRFDNYLDVEFLLTKKFTSNPFHVNPNFQLYLNKYISKKQRKLIHEEFDEFNNYNSLVLENLSGFFPPGFEFSLVNLQSFFDKFRIFGNIQMIYFPVNLINANSDFVPADFGFINFEVSENSNLNILKCVYYLNHLTYEEFNDFSESTIAQHDLTSDFDANGAGTTNGIHISISQHKHNHYLYQFCPTLLSLANGVLSVSYIDMAFHSAFLNNFARYSNYQETNIYVNNFPTLFANNDAQWERFWQRFGAIKSAKIIKPQFYAKEDQSVGKIGFVFFEDFKMALKAIIITNNKLVSIDNSSYLIKTSFALQKLHRDRRKKSGDSLDQQLEAPAPYYYEYPERDEDDRINELRKSC
ncbi:hypothetical protein PSN45_002148 [Yamadazyma tenuis]|uniref:uncharacterized protein n=1 Tax=Candida tenuis TaxID=2315449 RepID=UPI0027A16044|nr:hypothetical protein PSN45_002148 [Yamadazyma tenuis]